MGYVLLFTSILLGLIVVATGMDRLIYDKLKIYLSSKIAKKIYEALATGAFVGLFIEIPKEVSGKEGLAWYYLIIGIVFAAISGYLEE